MNQKTPECLKCGSKVNMVDHDGDWVCHSTHRLETCGYCGCDITQDRTSPEPNECVECFYYQQDLKIEAQENRQIISREMAMDAGFPEMEGHEW